jgi:hypothetical protein
LNGQTGGDVAAGPTTGTGQFFPSTSLIYLIYTHTVPTKIPTKLVVQKGILPVKMLGEFYKIDIVASECDRRIAL